jgi:tetratricopeptide (TPR) repeat protein
VQLVEPLLGRFRPLAREFGDFETLGRIGRLFKEMGDRRWQRSNIPPERFRGSDPWQFYRNALAVYQEAFAAVPDDYYTGINAATLAALTGDMEEAARLAESVAKICQSLSEISWGDRYWVFATQGEAAVLLGQTEEAVRFYATAIGELGPDQGGMANSTYKQLRRLHRGFRDSGDVRVGPVLRVFEESAFASNLSDPFGAASG